MYVDVLKRDVFFDLFYLFSIILYIFANTGRTTRLFCRYNYTFLFGCLLNVCNFQCYII